MFEVGVKDILDIVLVAVILFSCYKLMKQSRSVNIFYGLLLFISFWIIISKVVEMKLLGSILDQVVSVGAIAVIVLFQEEIRHFFFRLGTHERANRFINFFRPKKQIKGDAGEEFRHSRSEVSPIVLACLNMAKNRVGALIVMQNDLPLGDFVRTGERIDAILSQRLLENIFFKTRPFTTAPSSSTPTASWPLRASCPCPTIWISPRTSVCAIAPPKGSPRRPTLWLWWSARRRGASPWPTTTSSRRVSAPSSWSKS